MSDPRALEIDRPVENNEFVRARELLPRHRFVSFHEETLPALVLAHGSLVTEDLVGVAPVGFVLPTSEAFTYVPAPGGIEIRRGAEAAGVLVQLDEATFSDFANEIHSASGLVLGQRIAFVRGGLDGLKRWEPALRALYHGRRIWTPAEASALVDAQGAGLDLQRTFRLSDSDSEMREFLEVAGFLHLRDVFTTEEVRRFGDEVDRVRAAIVPVERG